MSESNSFKPLLFSDGKVRLTYIGFSKALLKCDVNGNTTDNEQSLSQWELNDKKTITTGLQLIFGVSDETLQNPAPIVITFDLKVNGLLGRTLRLMRLMTAVKVLNLREIQESLSAAVGLVFKAKLHTPTLDELWEIDPTTIEPYLENGVQVRDEI